MGLLDSLIGAATQAGVGSPQGQAPSSASGLPGGLDPQMLIGLVSIR